MDATCVIATPSRFPLSLESGHCGSCLTRAWVELRAHSRAYGNFSFLLTKKPLVSAAEVLTTKSPRLSSMYVSTYLLLPDATAACRCRRADVRPANNARCLDLIPAADLFVIHKVGMHLVATLQEYCTILEYLYNTMADTENRPQPTVHAAYDTKPDLALAIRSFLP